MARISDTLLVQRVEGEPTAALDQLVIIDESAGTEITVPEDQWLIFLAAIRYLTGL